MSYHGGHDYYDHTHSEDDYDSSEEGRTYYEEKSPIATTVATTVAATVANPTERSQSRYEVTEIIDDIPNTENTRIPIVANFTINRPLNQAPNNTAVANSTRPSNNQSNINSANNNETPNNLRKSTVSIFHVRAEFDDNKRTTPTQNIHIHKYPYLPGFRDYIHGVRRGVTQGLNTFINRDRHTNVNDPNVMAKPGFFNHFHNTGRYHHHNDFHRPMFGHQFKHYPDDDDDEI